MVRQRRADAKDVERDDLNKLKGLAAHPQVIALGETGLDYYYDHSPREIQLQVFAEFIRLDRELAPPLFVHERNAAHETAELRRNEGERNVRGVIHCFTGDYGAARTTSSWGFISRSLALSPSKMPPR